jgi:hypothetical protein
VLLTTKTLIGNYLLLLPLFSFCPLPPLLMVMTAFAAAEETCFVNSLNGWHVEIPVRLCVQYHFD